MMISDVLYYSPWGVRLFPGLSRGIFTGVENKGIATSGEMDNYTGKKR